MEERSAHLSGTTRLHLATRPFGLRAHRRIRHFVAPVYLENSIYLTIMSTCNQWMGAILKPLPPPPGGTISVTLDKPASWFENFPNKVNGSLLIPNISTVANKHIFSGIEKKLIKLGSRITSSAPCKSLEFNSARRWDRLSSFNAPATGDGSVSIVESDGSRFLFYKLDISASILVQVAACIAIPILLCIPFNLLLYGIFVSVMITPIWLLVMWLYTAHATREFFSHAIIDAISEYEADLQTRARR